MNCAMMNGMTTSVKGSESEVALFLHQMIPHHQNAVNMAKGEWERNCVFISLSFRGNNILSNLTSVSITSSHEDGKSTV